MTFGDTTSLRRRKYAVLLGILLAAVVVQSFAIGTSSRTIWLDIMETFMVVAIYLVVFERSAALRIMTVVLLLVVLIGWAHRLPISSFDHALSVVYKVGTAIF